MATHNDDTAPSTTSGFASTMRCHVVRPDPQNQRPNDADADADMTSWLPDTSAKTTDGTHDAPSPLISPCSDFDNHRSNLAIHCVPTFGAFRLKTILSQLYLLLVALVLQVAVMASDIVSLKNRMTVVEGTASASPHSQDNEVLVRPGITLREYIASQEARVATLERSHHGETDAYKKRIQELTTRIDDDKKVHDDTVERFYDSIKTLRYSTECHAARTTGIRADASRKIAVLQSELAGLRTELAALRMIALPAEVASAGQAAKEARKTRILASVAQRMEDVELAQEIEKMCPLPPAVTRSTGPEDGRATSSSSNSGPITTTTHGKETTTTHLQIPKKQPATARNNVTQPGADKIPSIPTIPRPTIPKPMIPTGRRIPANGSGKENKPCNDSKVTTAQHTQMLQPGAGRSRDVGDKPPTASRRKVQPSAGPSKISAPPAQPRRSMLPAPRKSQPPSLSKHAVPRDGPLNGTVKKAKSPPGGSVTRTKQPMTANDNAIATSSQTSSESAVEKGAPAGRAMPTSSSFTHLDAALQGMQQEGEDVLPPIPTLDDDDNLGFEPISEPTNPMSMRRGGSVMSASSSFTHLDAALQGMQLEGDDVLMPIPMLDFDDDLGFEPIADSATPMNMRREGSGMLASSSFTHLDAALKGMQPEGEDVLAPMPILDFDDGFGFEPITEPTASMRTRRKREDKSEGSHGPSVPAAKDVKRARVPLIALAENQVASFSTALAPESQVPQRTYDTLTLGQRPEYPNAYLGFSTVIPLSPKAELPFKRETIYVSPAKTPRPSRRL